MTRIKEEATADARRWTQMKSASINIYPESAAYRFLAKGHFIWFKSGDLAIRQKLLKSPQAKRSDSILSASICVLLRFNSSGLYFASIRSLSDEA